MNWSIIIATVIGLVVGANLGVLLMAALQAGRRQDDESTQAMLDARIRDQETKPTETREVSVSSQGDAVGLGNPKRQD